MKLTRIIFNQYLILAIIIVLAFVVRLYKIDSPIADWHSWRQADTAAVARNFYLDGYNPLFPQGDDLSVISENGQYNLHRYRFVEFPIVNSLVYFTYVLNGGVDERLARLVSVLFSLGSIIFLFLLTRKYFGKVTALLAAFFFAFLPYNIYYSRTVLAEPSLLFFSLGMLYFIDRWIFENKLSLYLWGVFFAACAFLTKPTAVFYTAPLIYSYFKKEKKLFPIPLRYFALVIPSLLPLGLWRWWMSNYPEGIPAAAWLLNGNGIRLHPAWWWWIFGDRLGREILSIAGGALFFLGALIRPREKEGWFMHVLILSLFLYLVIFATGNVQHDYYQILIVPGLTIFLARGVTALIEGYPNILQRILSIPLGLVLIALTLFLGWHEVSGLYQINNPAIVEAGKAANALLPKNALVIAPYGGDTAFLYQTDRHGFPIVTTSIPEMVKQFGVSYYISVNKDDNDTRYALQHYSVLDDQKDFVIVDLTKPKG